MIVLAPPVPMARTQALGGGSGDLDKRLAVVSLRQTNGRVRPRPDPTGEGLDINHGSKSAVQRECAAALHLSRHAPEPPAPSRHGRRRNIHALRHHQGNNAFSLDKRPKKPSPLRCHNVGWGALRTPPRQAIRRRIPPKCIALIASRPLAGAATPRRETRAGHPRKPTARISAEHTDERTKS